MCENQWPATAMDLVVAGSVSAEEVRQVVRHSIQADTLSVEQRHGWPPAISSVLTGPIASVFPDQGDDRHQTVSLIEKP
jgi:hypothetical protein